VVHALSFQHTTGSWTADPQGGFPIFTVFCSPTLHKYFRLLITYPSISTIGYCTRVLPLQAIHSLENTVFRLGSRRLRVLFPIVDLASFYGMYPQKPQAPATRSEMIENNSRTSRISGFGLGGENRARRFSFSPQLRHRPYSERQLQRPREILNYFGFNGMSKRNPFYKRHGISLRLWTCHLTLNSEGCTWL